MTPSSILYQSQGSDIGGKKEQIGFDLETNRKDQNSTRKDFLTLGAVRPSATGTKPKILLCEKVFPKFANAID